MNNLAVVIILPHNPKDSNGKDDATANPRHQHCEIEIGLDIEQIFFLGRVKEGIPEELKRRKYS
jgi:hypothetical protein